MNEFSIGGHRASLPLRSATGLGLVRQVNTGGSCFSVCQYKSYTYVGLRHGAVDRIDERGKVTLSFIKSSSHVISIRAHNDRLYMLVYGQPYKVCVYVLTGQLINSWHHPGGTYYLWISASHLGNKISIIGDQLAAADTVAKRLILYKLNGDFVKHIDCPLMSDDSVAMCEAGGDSVIISGSIKVFRINLASEKVEWSTDVAEPHGVVCYGREYVLVATRNNLARVWMLNVKSGRL